MKIQALTKARSLAVDLRAGAQADFWRGPLGDEGGRQ
jgi:hypothetical protein